jgi:hypothetical protein
MLKICIHEMPRPGDKLHLRHFFEALLASKSADVKAHEEAIERDFTFTYNSSFHPPSGQTVLYFAHDPHALATDMDLSDMLDPELLELSIKLGTPADFHGSERERFMSHISYSVAPYLNSFDVYAPIAYEPLAKRLGPKLDNKPCIVIPHTAPGWIFNATLREERPVDFFFLGASGPAYYPLRAVICNRIKTALSKKLEWAIPGYGLPSCAELNSDWTVEQFDEHQHWYADRLREAKISAFDGSVYRYPLSRYAECMAAGCLVLATMPWDGERLGFADGVNMVEIGPGNWEEKLFYYLEHEDERVAIVERAHKFVNETHTCEARAEIVIKQLEELKCPT